MGLIEMSAVLWREREALELLLFKLDEERLLLLAGQARWLGNASREVEAALEQVSELELVRAVETAAVATELEVGDDDRRLVVLAGAVGAPWRSVLELHLQAIRRLTGAILDAGRTNRRLLAEGLERVRAALATQPGHRPARLLLEAAAYEAALSTNRRVLQPSLVDEVRG